MAVQHHHHLDLGPVGEGLPVLGLLGARETNTTDSIPKFHPHRGKPPESWRILGDADSVPG